MENNTSLSLGARESYYLHYPTRRLQRREPCRATRLRDRPFVNAGSACPTGAEFTLETFSRAAKRAKRTPISRHCGEGRRECPNVNHQRRECSRLDGGDDDDLPRG